MGSSLTGPRRSLSLKLSDTRVYEPQIRARLGTTAHFCKVVILNLQPHLHYLDRPVPHSAEVQRLGAVRLGVLGAVRLGVLDCLLTVCHFGMPPLNIFKERGCVCVREGVCV